MELRQTDGKRSKFLVTVRQRVCNMIVSGELAAAMQPAVMSFARSWLLHVDAMFCEVINLIPAMFFFAVSLR